MSEQEAGRNSPYRGLQPFDERDAAFFFGRERETRLITASLFASPLTLLYGASGVGKTSVLRAGVLPRLRERRELLPFVFPTVGIEPQAKSASVVLRGWQNDPLGGIKETAAIALYASAGDDSALRSRFQEALLAHEMAPLGEFLGACHEVSGRRLMVILDQFEEYSLYHPEDDAFGEQFPSAITPGDLSASFLISLREDALAKLDRFKGRIPALWDSYRRVDHLDRGAAEDAIRLPLREYNRQHAGREPMKIEDPLVEAVLREVQTESVQFEEAGGGTLAARNGAERRIETPYLQMVLERLWDTEMAQDSRTMRLATLKDLGGAEKIVRTHLDNVMETLGETERDIAARVFRFLVTPNGAKIALDIPTLASWAEVEGTQAEPVMEKLARAESRVLRAVAPPSDQPESLCYEIFHDVLAPAVLDWRARYVKAQELQEAERQAETERLRADQQTQQAKELRVALETAQENEVLARSRELIANSLVSQDVDPELSVLIAAHAVAVTWQRGHTVLPEAEQQLHRAILASHVRLTVSGHKDSVWSVAWSPDGKRLATGSDDKTAKVWNARTGRELLTLSGHSGGISSVAWSPDGRRLATGSDDNTAKVWDATTGKEVLTLRGHRRGVWSVAWSPDGKRLATGGTDYTAKEWDAGTGKELLTLSGHLHWVSSVAWSPDCKRLATGSDDNTAKVWNARTGKELLTLSGHSDSVQSVAWSPDGKRLATGSDDKTAKVWNAKNGKELLTLSGHRDWVWSVVWSSDGKRLATGGTDYTSRVWNAETGKELLILSGHRDLVLSVAWSPDGKRLATGSEDKAAKVWDAEAGKELLTLRGHRREVSSVAWNPDGNQLATASDDKTAKVWDVETGKRLLTLRGHRREVSSVAWSLDGNRLATASDDKTAKVWDAETGKELLALRGHRQEVSSVAWSADGKRLTTGSLDNTAKVWDAGTGEELLTLKGHRGRVWTVAWSPDGRRLATGSDGKTARVWDAKSGEELLSLYGHSDSVASVAWSPDGERLTTGSDDRTAKIWDATTGKELLSLKGHSGYVLSVAWSPDGKRLATGSDDNTVKVWDAEKGRELLTLSGHGDWVFSVAWSADGKRLATGSSDKTVRVYAIDIHDLMALARERVTAHPSEEGCKKYLQVEKCPPFPELSLK